MANQIWDEGRCFENLRKLWGDLETKFIFKKNGKLLFSKLHFFGIKCCENRFNIVNKKVIKKVTPAHYIRNITYSLRHSLSNDHLSKTCKIYLASKSQHFLVRNSHMVGIFSNKLNRFFD